MKKNLINPNQSVKIALKNMRNNGEKCLIVVGKKNKLLGSLSDGDVRNAILNNISINSPIKKIYKKNCIFFTEDNYNLAQIKKIFISQIISLIPIVDNNKQVVQIIEWNQVFNEKNKNNFNKIKLPIVIMAGGKGNRLMPFTKFFPKPLMPLNEQTVIENIIEKFKYYGANNFFLSIHYKAFLIKAYFKELSPDYKIQFIEEKKPLGTAGGLSLLKNKVKTTFFVTNCDVIINENYNDIYEFHLNNKNDLTIVVSAKQITLPYGTCLVDKKGSLKNIIEKPNYDFLVNTGLYILEPGVINLIPKNTNIDFNDFIKICMKKKKKIRVFPIESDSWMDIGQLSEYKKNIEKF